MMDTATQDLSALMEETIPASVRREQDRVRKELLGS